MKSILRALFPSKNLDAIPASLAGAVIIYFYTRHSGIGMSPDSVAYASTAKSLLLHKGLVDFDNQPLVIFPAFYPMFLSAVMWLSRLRSITFAPLLNELLFALVIYLSGWIMARSNTRRWLKWIVLACLVFSPALLEVYSMLWSETLFVLLSLLFLIGIAHYLKHNNLRSLLFPAFVAALACVTRYAGVTLILSGGLLILMQQNELVKKLLHFFYFGLISSSLLAINIIHNTLATGTGTGQRERSLSSLGHNIYYYGHVFFGWLTIVKDNYIIESCLALLIIFGFVILLFLHKKAEQAYIRSCLVFFLIYSLFIIISSTLSRYERINSRLLSPLFIPFLIVLVYWLQHIIQDIPAKRRWLIIAAGILIAVSLQISQLDNDYENWDGIKDAGIPGYTEDSWTQSETVKYLEKNIRYFQRDYTVYSDADEAVYFFTGRRADLLPHKEFPDEVSDLLTEDHFYLIFFNDAWNPELISLKDVQAHRKLICLKKFDDGAIYVSGD